MTHIYLNRFVYFDLENESSDVDIDWLSEWKEEAQEEKGSTAPPKQGLTFPIDY